MPSILGLAIVMVIALAGVIVYVSVRAVQKRARLVDSSFGQLGAHPMGRRNAAAYWEALNAEQPDPLCVDDVTWNDLEMDDVFRQINCCHSAAGDIRLYNVLRRPVKEQPLLAEREALARMFTEDDALRKQIQREFARLGRWEGSAIGFVRFHVHTLHLPNRWLYCLLAFLPLLSLPVFFYSVPFGILAVLVAATINISIHSTVKLKNDSGFSSVRFLASSLRSGRKLARMLRSRLPELAARLNEADAALAGVRRSCQVLAFDDLMESNGLLDPLLAFQLPMLCYSLALKGLRNHAQAISQLYDALGDLDVAASIVSLRAALPLWVRPAFSGGKQLSCESLYHPLLDEPVTNDAAFTQNALFTGSNASGKSTFLKALALNCIFAQTLNTCTASQFFCHAGAVATSMAARDTVSSGDSYFMAEIKSMRRLLEIVKISDFSYFYIDEILRGTNTVERVAAATSVLEYLCGPACLCFAASHDIELTQLLAACYKNWHFQEQVKEQGVRFDFKLREGPATSRNAILLLQTTGFPATITKAARSRAEQFDATGRWQ